MVATRRIQLVAFPAHGGLGSLRSWPMGHPPARRVRQALAALLLAALTVTAGCSSDDPPASEPKSSTTPTSEPTPEPSPAVEPSEDTSIQDALDEAGIPADLKRQVVAAADAAGYGPANEGFVVLMVEVCRDVESGYSDWDELVDQDAADGAPRADAQQLYDFVKTRLCPYVRAAPDAPQPSGNAAAVGDGTRGLGSSAEFLDANWKHGDTSACRAAVGAPLGDPRAYAIASGALVCGGAGLGVYGDTFINLDVVFDPPVSEAAALKVAEKLLPADAEFVDRLMGKNPKYAARDGSCPSIVYTSQALADAVNAAADDGVDEQGPEANATLYSDRQTNYGSSSVFNGQVRTLSLSIGGHNLGYQAKTPTC